VERQPAGAARPGLGSLLARLVGEAKSLVTDYAELAVLDARRAALNLAWLLGAVLVVAVLVITAWMGLVASLIIWMFNEGVSWGIAIGVAALLNLLAAGGLLYWMRHLLAELPFTALLRQLRGEDPPPPPLTTAGGPT
jgi:uncharacterized membrane protein YqjE